MVTLFGFRYAEHFKKIKVSEQRNGTIMENVLTHIKAYMCRKYSVYVCFTLFPGFFLKKQKQIKTQNCRFNLLLRQFTLIFQRVKTVWFELNITVLFRALVNKAVKRDTLKIFIHIQKQNVQKKFTEQYSHLISITTIKNIVF